MKTNHTIDHFDLKILRELQRNGGVSNQDLAEKVGLTAAPCSRRVKALEDSGIILDRVVRLDERAVDLNLMAILHISMDKHIPERFEAFEKTIIGFPEVMECYLITGHDADYQLKVAVPDMDRYHDILLGKITRIQGVTGVKSSFIMRKIVDTTAVPLNYIG
ncbi:Lrp/AsnC family transcriptional regulator [Amphritea sp. 1_MG-2023]|uniref:Lrp/AsnC family transcriptional regulator n=1 Tax=Amphritea sp. 1_MG-2023 TaxID=3062670 RepID=UPI0026E13EFF|nr:Lrp/AsnC family transcriptional regulator [Amphritea sp. 1_MG-2023]MDO6561850.1 Lrp/AsnC family transcriptional regulator [Amphritea sp. 1_MG-2023]